MGDLQSHTHDWQDNVRRQILKLGYWTVAGLACSNLDISNVNSFDAEISHLIVIMALTYLATLFTLTRKMQ